MEKYEKIKFYYIFLPSFTRNGQNRPIPCQERWTILPIFEAPWRCQSVVLVSNSDFWVVWWCWFSEFQQMSQQSEWGWYLPVLTKWYFEGLDRRPYVYWNIMLWSQCLQDSNWQPHLSKLSSSFTLVSQISAMLGRRGAVFSQPNSLPSVGGEDLVAPDLVQPLQQLLYPHARARKDLGDTK